MIKCPDGPTIGAFFFAISRAVMLKLSGHISAGVRAFPAGFGAFPAMFGFVIGAFVGAGFANIGANLANLPRSFASEAHQLG